MINCDYHTHTTYCDGKNTPREMVEAAVRRKMVQIGISGHAPQPFDNGCCMSKDSAIGYNREVRSLKKEFAQKIKVFCGIEKDLFSDADTKDFDYVIGSVHYIKTAGGFIAVDESADALKKMIEQCFDGDALAMCEAYFDNAAQIGEALAPDIVGHFDLVTKYNKDGRFFDESSPRYTAAWKRAADRLLKTCRLFEINTGAMFRVGKDRPYPSPEMISYIKERGGRFILSSDSHCADSLCFNFDKYEHLADIKSLF